jgi:hypothetical protein
LPIELGFGSLNSFADDEEDDKEDNSNLVENFILLN